MLLKACGRAGQTRFRRRINLCAGFPRGTLPHGMTARVPCGSGIFPKAQGMNRRFPAEVLRKKKMPGEAATSTEQTGNNTTHILNQKGGKVK